MNLSADQKTQVAAWLAGGMNLSDVQQKLKTDFNVSLTYMEVRFLLDDLDLAIKDKPAPKELKPAPKPAPTAMPEDTDLPAEDGAFALDEEDVGGTSSVQVSIDTVQRPGAVVSGNVTFSDGQSAAWHIDQFGRLALVAKQEGYKPTPADIQAFQLELQTLVRKRGY